MAVAMIAGAKLSAALGTKSVLKFHDSLSVGVGAEAPLVLAAGDLDGEHGRHFGVLGVCLCAEGFDEGFLVEDRLVRLNVGSLEQDTFDNLRTACGCRLFDGIFDGIGLGRQVFDLSQQRTECVDVVEVEIVVHNSLSVRWF